MDCRPARDGTSSLALDATDASGKQRQALADLIHGIAEKSHYPATFQWIRKIWPVARNATAGNVEPVDHPVFFWPHPGGLWI